MSDLEEPMESAESKQRAYERKTSVSEAFEASHGGFHAPSWLSWVEYPFRIKNPMGGPQLPEVTGWAFDSAGRGPLNLVGSFVGGAILQMAIKEAGGPNETVKGLLKPSSFLTATTSLIGIVAAILMPVFGAVVDHTRYRRLVGVVSGVMAFSLIGMQMSISVEKNNWFYILILDALQSFALLVHHTAVFAYLPDLSRDEEVTSHYTSNFNQRQYGVQVFYACLLLIIAVARGTQGEVGLDVAVQSARTAAGIAFGIGAFCFGYAWIFLFRDRPALSQVPEGSNLLSTGFVQVHRTAKKIWKDYGALKWFMISLLWSPEAGAGVTLSIAVTYLTVIMQFTINELTVATLILLVVTVFGSMWAKKANQLLNPLNSYRIAMTLMGASVGLGSAFFTGPDRKNVVYGFSVLWGFFLGWTYPSQRVLFCTLIPKGQETEMMGLFTFTGQIFGWLPPFVVTMMNENDISLKYSLLVIFCFCFAAVVCTLPMGDYETAKALVERDSAEKLEQVVASASLGAKSAAKNNDDDEEVGKSTEVSTASPNIAEQAMSEASA